MFCTLNIEKLGGGPGDKAKLCLNCVSCVRGVATIEACASIPCYGKKINDQERLTQYLKLVGSLGSASSAVSGGGKYSEEQLQQRQRGRFKLDWDLLFWMFASFATLYFTNFASNLLFNDKINRYTL